MGMKHVTLTVLSALTASLIAVSAGAAEPKGHTTEEASIARGARLYEDWAHESGEREEILPNPEFKTKDVRVPAADTWRCVTCHGWDYKGQYDFPSIRKREGGNPAFARESSPALYLPSLRAEILAQIGRAHV